MNNDPVAAMLKSQNHDKTLLVWHSHLDVATQVTTQTQENVQAPT